jgi:predicted DNA-binding transcriptional regulator AlpA
MNSTPASSSVRRKLTWERPTKQAVSDLAGGFYISKGRELMGHKLIQFCELKSVKGIPFTRRHIARLEDNGEFPQRVKIGQHRIGWVESEIDTHILEKITARPARKNAAGATLH